MGRSFFSELERLKSKFYEDDNPKGLEIIGKVDKFISDASYVSTNRQKEFVSLRFRSDSEIAEKMGISEVSVRYWRSEVSKKLFNIFGVNFLLALQNGDFESCDLILSLLRSDSVSFPECIKKELDFSEVNSSLEFSIPECLEEIKFLKELSPKGIQKRLEILDKDKLFYLDRVLGSPKMRKQQIEFLKLWLSDNI